MKNASRMNSQIAKINNKNLNKLKLEYNKRIKNIRKFQ